MEKIANEEIANCEAVLSGGLSVAEARSRRAAGRNKPQITQMFADFFFAPLRPYFFLRSLRFSASLHFSLRSLRSSAPLRFPWRSLHSFALLGVLCVTLVSQIINLCNLRNLRFYPTATTSPFKYALSG